MSGRWDDRTREWIGREVRAGMLFCNLNVLKLDYGIGAVLMLTTRNTSIGTKRRLENSPQLDPRVHYLNANISFGPRTSDKLYVHHRSTLQISMHFNGSNNC